MMNEKHGYFRNGEFVLCLVWSPIPLLSWIIPFIGHIGISTSEGLIHDFGGPYWVNKSKRATAFGSVTKFAPLQIGNINGDKLKQDDLHQVWDEAVEHSSCKYEKMMHNLIFNNCHSHVAVALNELEYASFSHWNTLFLILYMCAYSRFTGWSGFLKTYLPFFILSGIILACYFISQSV